jgi:hypothetical protein
MEPPSACLRAPEESRAGDTSSAQAARCLEAAQPPLAPSHPLHAPGMIVTLWPVARPSSASHADSGEGRRVPAGPGLLHRTW